MNITQEIAKRVVQTSIRDLPADAVGYSETLAMSALGAWPPATAARAAGKSSITSKAPAAPPRPRCSATA
ncbi:Uncharacterised protein [Bordetella pertussis]|nr:Uncharacterised protein [Bordetella pertussis]